MTITRRTMLLAMLATACSSTERDVQNGRLRSRPLTLHPLLASGERDLKLRRPAILYIPEKARGSVALLLHGAGGQPDRILNRFRPQADEFGVSLLAVKSQRQTWDGINGWPGPDLTFIDEALRAAFTAIDVDAAHLAVGGFSDGATYALALGLANGDLFSHVLAFSPGFLIPLPRTGRARFFLSHGTEDPILPIESGSRRIAAELRSAGLSVTLREFDDGHTVPPEVAREAFQWFTR